MWAKKRVCSPSLVAKGATRLTALVLMLGVGCAATSAAVAADFVLRDVKMTGLVRVLPAEVYKALPMTTGDQVNATMIAKSIKQLYETGKFEYIEVSASDNNLVYAFTERAKLVKLSFKGNKKIATTQISDAATAMDIKEGAILQPDKLQKFEQDLQAGYALQGYYDAQVAHQLKALPNNQVELEVTVKEGKPSKVLQIQVAGNTVFSDQEIRKIMVLKEKSHIPLLGPKGIYTKEALADSVERIKRAYRNKGYVKVDVPTAETTTDNAQKKVFIDIRISEGEVYSFAGAEFIGGLVDETPELAKLVQFNNSDKYSQQKVEQTSTLLERRYANEGYFFSKVRAYPDINEQDKTVRLQYLVEKGKSVYVRNISFKGNVGTTETVMRHELRQMESSLASKEKLELSKQRLLRTGFFKTVEYEAVPVPGADDQIDIVFNVVEDQTGQSTVSVGFSQSSGLTFQLGLSENNFVGSGRAVSVALERSEVLESVNVSVSDPYYNVNGVNQSYSVFYNRSKADPRNVSRYLRDVAGVSYTLGYPINEYERISAGLTADRTVVKGNNGISELARDYILANGGSKYDYTEPAGIFGFIDPPLTSPPATTPALPVPTTVPYDLPKSLYKGTFNALKLNLNWQYNSLNRPLFPTSGSRFGVNLQSTVPGIVKQDFQKLTLNGDVYKPLTASHSFSARAYAKLGIGRNLPFFQNFTAGGLGSVRGYDNNRLGPRSPDLIEGIKLANKMIGTDENPECDLGTPVNIDPNFYLVDPAAINQCGYISRLTDPSPEYVGGALQTLFGGEVAFPLPTKADWASKIRPVLFIDGGNVFKNESTFDVKEWRFGYGIGFTWMTFIGPISFHYTIPLKNKPGDEVQTDAFDIGTIF